MTEREQRRMRFVRRGWLATVFASDSWLVVVTTIVSVAGLIVAWWLLMSR